MSCVFVFFFFKQKTAYEMRISDWSSDVCSSDLVLHHRSTRQDNAEAIRMADRAIALDPKYAHAHAWRACILGQTWVYGWCADREATFNEVVEELQTAQDRKSVV